MHLLESLLAHMDAYEKSEYYVFIGRFKAQKELQLAKLLASDENIDSSTIRENLYGDSTTDKRQRAAYNAMRKKLTERTIEFLVTLRLNTESTPSGKIFGLMIVAQLLIERNGVETARMLLDKAEELAIQRRRYDVLDTIYGWLIDHADSMGISAKEIIRKWESNKFRHDKMMSLRQLIAQQREQIQLAKAKGLALNPDNSIRNIQKKLKVTKDDANDPHFLMLYCRLIRSAIVMGKDYTSFEGFIEKIYNRLKTRGLFTENDIEFVVEMLFMLAHAAYRNRKFEKATLWCNDISQIRPEKWLRTQPVYPRYMALRAGIAALQGNVQDAINDLEKALSNALDHSEITEWLNLRLNLAVYYFQSNNFRKAYRTLLTIGKNNSELQTLMGLEWCFKKQMIELIIQYELGNTDLSEKMAKQLRVEYAKMLTHPMYLRADIFLNLINTIAKDPQVISSQEFQETVKSSRLAWPNFKEDIQAITFFCWLKAKMEKRPYYEVLLERVNE